MKTEEARREYNYYIDTKDLVDKWNKGKTKDPDPKFVDLLDRVKWKHLA